ncbi:MAG: OmcA/MtrC family decaheme c-type cytochrome [Thermoanaerobaculia bacterium]
MVGVQRGLLILMAAGAVALGPSAQKTSGVVQGVPDDGTPAQATYQVNQKEYFIDPGTLWGLQPGLNATIVGTPTNVAGGQKPVVEFWVKDDLGRPLDRYGVLTPGTISPRFTVATWDGHYYTNLIVSGGNPSRDTAGSIQDIEVGHYKYTFSMALPSFDNTKAVTLFMGASRATSAILGKNYYVNVTKDFIPSTGAATTNWSVTTTAKCNQCHDPIAPHGGNYREAKVCAICHNVNNFPTRNANGNWYNGQNWFHQIHSSNSSTIPATYPQDLRACTTCHDTGKSTSVDKIGVWFTYPTRAACGGCHADINWVTGQNHSAQNLPQPDDTACATCHPPQGTDEYDTSIINAHIVPSDSKQLQGLKVTILSTAFVAPGSKPTVTFKITQNDGSIVPPNQAGLSISMTIDGNTIDYPMQAVSESATADAFNATTGVVTHNFKYMIPANATGTWCFSAQARRTVNLVMAVGGTISYTEGAVNPIVYVSVDGSTVYPRRTAVALAKCNVCHYNLANLFSHGGQRIAIEFCVQCHNPNGTDASARGTNPGPAEGISFAHMIHRIHTGDQLVSDFSIYGHSGTPTPFNEVTYPGDRRDCLVCHASVAAFSPPIQAGALNSLTPRDLFSPQGPATAACLGCHDADDFQAHAYINTANLPNGTVAEACGACHGANSDLSPAKVHAQ